MPFWLRLLNGAAQAYGLPEPPEKPWTLARLTGETDDEYDARCVLFDLWYAGDQDAMAMADDRRTVGDDVRAAAKRLE